MEKFAAYFAGVPDPRAENARHDLLEVIFIALTALLCGAESCSDMADFGAAKMDLLKQILKLEHGVPSHDTFSRVFRLIDPERFEAAFSGFTTAFAGPLQGVVAIDGKALRGAYERGCKATPLHLVNVWAVEARAAVAQRLAPGRNEVAGALEAVALLDLSACIVTADALHCRPDMAAAIRGQGGDYVLALKDNHPRLLASAKAALDTGPVEEAVSEPIFNHGRVERRRAVVAVVQNFAEAATSATSPPSPASRPIGRSMTSSSPRSCATSCSPHLCPPIGCCRWCEAIGPSRTNFTGCSTSPSTRTAPAAERTTPHRTSPP